MLSGKEQGGNTMTSESPVFLTKIECPVCKTLNEYETIRLGAYTERDRDTDFCPTDIVWRNPRYQAYNPLLYFTATCSNCFYTREFGNNYKEWKKDSYFKTYRLKTVKDRHLQALAEAGSIFKMIGKELDPKRHPVETAILKLILAIIDESFNDKMSDLDLGRFYLRIGWLFRDMERGENPNLQAVKGCLIEIDNKFNELKSEIEKTHYSAKVLNNVISSQFDDEGLSAELKSILYPVRDKYLSEISSLDELFSLVDGKLESLELVAAEHKKLALGSSGDDIMAGFHEHRSFYDFLSKLAAKYDSIPLNEKSALEFAVKYYVRMYEDGRSVGEGNQQIQALYMIAELSRRTGEFDQAKEYFNKTIRSGQEFIHKNRQDQSRTALAKKILELAIEQGRYNLKEA
jgi:uncharacterized protein (DUF2225 family)